MRAGDQPQHPLDRLEVIEATTGALFPDKPLAPVVPMSDEPIAELKRVFKVE